MITLIVIGYLAVFMLMITPWIGNLNHGTIHRVDRMAGDEGDD